MRNRIARREYAAVKKLESAADAVLVTGRPREALETLLIARHILNDAIKAARKASRGEK